MNLLLRPTALFLIAIALATSCANPDPATQAQVQVAAEPPPPLTADRAEDRPGLHNVVRYADGLISGAVPEGEAGMRSIAAMGVRTIISVDGATPDVATAAKFGLRYVHLPIGYSGCSDERALELAQAVANLPGPIYMHCHHGKHRSAGALGTAAVLAGELTPAAAMARMKVSGTSPDYKGLWADVEGARTLPREQLRADPASFPAVAKVSGLVAMMTEFDVVFDNLKALQTAQWSVPPDHPDLVPAKETARLHDLHRQLAEEPESKAHPADYQDRLAKATKVVAELDAAVAAGNRDAAEKAFTAVQKSCKDCHKVHRDQ